MELLRRNWIYVLWATVYVILSWLFLGGTAGAFFLTLIAYAISISIALSPMGEAILRYVQGFRRIATSREKESLEEIFAEVYKAAREKNPDISSEIELYLSDKMHVNACAVGKRTICLTRGAIETFTPDELKGVIAHELGHISNGDTIALLLNVVGNGIFTIFILIMKVFFVITEMFTGGIVGVVAFLYRKAFELIVFLFMILGNILLSINSRQNEYEADRFAHEIGYGEELTEALYTLQRMSFGSGGNIYDRLMESHPHIAYRIERLEGLCVYN